MGSSLKNKLRVIQASSNAVRASDERKAAGFLKVRHERRVERETLIFPSDGLRRIGWSGRSFDIRQCLFLDAETTGLSGGAGTVAFLVGYGYVRDEKLIVEQLLMRDYASESLMLSELAAAMEPFQYVCTFNGRNFDMPLLESRFTMCRMRERWRDMENLDLMIPSRRIWKLRLESCRLSRLEEYVLGIRREGDLPGAEVPGRYFEYLKTGDEMHLADILKHNEQDIATLLELLKLLCGIYHRPEELEDPADRYSAGLALERQGELTAARAAYEKTAVPALRGRVCSGLSETAEAMANWRIYLLERRNRNYPEMLSILEKMYRRKQMRFEVCVELSKLYEHRLKKYRAAKAYAGEAMDCCPEGMEAELMKRIERIRAKEMKGEN